MNVTLSKDDWDSIVAAIRYRGYELEGSKRSRLNAEAKRLCVEEGIKLLDLADAIEGQCVPYKAPD